MLKKFVKYVSQNMLGMVGMSVYILADTYFISVAVGTDGITALNLVLPVYNMSPAAQIIRHCARHRLKHVLR